MQALTNAERAKRWYHSKTSDPEFRARHNRCNTQYRDANREEVRAYHREYMRLRRLNPEQREKDRAASRDYAKRNVKRISESQRLRRQQNLQDRLEHALRERIRAALSGRCKSARSLKLLGCSVEHWRTWLTFYFQPGMSWANYGKVWHIDHIRPCASFDLTDARQQEECFSYANTQPLFVAENLQKSDKW